MKLRLDGCKVDELKRMATYYPKVKVVVKDKLFFASFNKENGNILVWMGNMKLISRRPRLEVFRVPQS